MEAKMEANIAKEFLDRSENQAHQDLLQLLKQAFTSTAVFANFDCDMSLLVTTNASAVALGAY